MPQNVATGNPEAQPPRPSRVLRDGDALLLPDWDPQFSANLAACERFGITEPVASALSGPERRRACRP